jgi:hypothetical protein
LDASTESARQSGAAAQAEDSSIAESGSADTESPSDTQGVGVVADGPMLPAGCPQGTPCVSCTTNLNQVVLAIDPRAVGSCISTYGQTVATSAAQRMALSQLGLGRYRIPIRWNNGNPISSAGGGPQNISADGYVSALKAMGAETIVVIGGDTGDNDFSPADAANLVTHFTAMGVSTFYLGNEPGNGGMSIEAYSTLFNACAQAMRKANPNIKIGGPTWAYYDLPTMQTFLQLSGPNVDILDFHDYAMGSPPALSTSDALAATHAWGDEVTALYAALSSQGLSGRQVSVGEYNWAWQLNDGVDGGDARFFDPIITVWAASVIGHVLSTGGWPFQYSDQNGPLGLTVQVGSADQGKPQSAPQPIYHGLGMWTGEGLFRSFGAQMLSSSCADSNVEIYATTGPNVMLVNKSTTAESVALTWNVGSGHLVDIWQTDPNNGYVAPSVIRSGGAPATSIFVALPAVTVTQLVVR